MTNTSHSVESPTGRRRGLWRLLRWVGYGLLGLLLLIAGLFILQPRVDVTFLKETFEEGLTSAVESPVTLEKVFLRLGVWTTVDFEGLLIESRAVETSPPLLQAEVVELRLALWPFLHDRLEIRGLKVDGVRLHIGSNREEEATSSELTYEFVELLDAELTDIRVTRPGANGELDEVLNVARLSAGIGQDSPLELDLAGNMWGRALDLAVVGGTLGQLTGGREDWPLEGTAHLGDLEIEVTGLVATVAAGRSVLDVHLRSRGYRWLSEPLGVEVPDLGELELAGSVSIDDSGIGLADLQGRLGDSVLSGAIDYRAGEPRGRLSGRLDFGRLSLEGLDLLDLAASPELEAEAESAAEESTDPMAAFESLDVDLAVSASVITGLSVELSDVSGSLSVEAGDLVLPLAAVIDDGSFAAELRIGSDGIAEINLRASNLRSATVAALRPEAKPPEARIGTLSLEARAPVAGGLESWSAAALSVEVLDSEMTLDGDEPVQLSVTRLVAKQELGAGLVGSLEGYLAGEAFDLDISAPSARRLTSDERLRFEVVGTGSGAEITLEAYLSLGDEESVVDVTFGFSGGRLADLATWSGVSPAAEMPYEFRGRWHSVADARSLELDRIRIGRTIVDGRFSWEREGDPMVVELSSQTVDPKELNLVFGEVAAVDTADERIEFDVPALPSGVSFNDADVDISVERVLRDKQDFTDLQATVRFRDGRLEPSPFRFAMGDASFNGSLDLDLRGEVPEATLDIEATHLDLGSLLVMEDVAEELDLTARRLALHFTARRGTGGHLLARGDFTAEAEGLLWRVRDPASGKVAELDLPTARLESSAARPLDLSTRGSFAGEPFELRLSDNSSGGEPRTDGRVPIRLDLLSGSTRLSASTEIELPFEAGNAWTVEMSGPSLAELGPLLGMDLPAFGPYSVGGVMQVSPRGYELTGLDVRLVESDLTGKLSLLTDGERPVLRGSLSSHQFRFVDLAAAGSDEGIEETEEGEGGAVPEEKSGGTEWLQDESNPLESIDLDLDLFVERLWTGDVLTESARLAVDLENGRLGLMLDADREDLERRVDLHIDPVEAEMEARLKARVTGFDYGQLAQALDPDTEINGILSIDLDLTSRAAALSDLATDVNGHFDFTLYPQGFDSSVLDIWADGLIRTLVDTSESKVNCITGRFTATNGLLEPEQLLLDTSRIRVRGRGSLDLNQGWVDFDLKPRPKQRALVNLATPVRVSGPLEDMSIKVKTGGLTMTVFRISMWFWTMYLELLRKPLPTDGHDICIDPVPRGLSVGVEAQ